MIGVIGGTGLYQMEGLSQIREQEIGTPFGPASAPVTVGELAGRPVAFLPRHGKSHQLLPSEINYRANIYALKKAGVTRLFSVSAVGSLQQEIAPGDLAIPSQYLDLTKGKRPHTFFGDGLVAHVSTAEPTCPGLATKASEVASQLDYQLHRGKTYACVEGPRLGTRAESNYLRRMDCHLVGMTNVPEAFLAREAQICYCTLAVSTDYDCWLDDPSQHASVDKILALYKQNLGRVQRILQAVLSSSDEPSTDCSCRAALRYAILTPESSIPAEKRLTLEVLKA